MKSDRVPNQLGCDRMGIDNLPRFFVYLNRKLTAESPIPSGEATDRCPLTKP